jgi:heptosyltransferase-3
MNRILVIQLRQLGDILLTTPCLKAVRYAFPHAQIAFLSHAMGSLVIDGSPYVDEHFTFDSKDSVKDHLSLMWFLRRQKFDLVLDFMGNPRSALYALASGGKRRVGFASIRQAAYHTVVPRPGSGRYIVDGKFSLLNAVGVPAVDRGLVLPWGEEHVRVTENFVTSQPGFRDATCRVVLSPTHRRLPRRWPLERYAQLADYLVKEWGASVTWLWGPGEEQEIDAAIALTKEPTTKAPKTSFREMAALIANTDLFIGNSNGPSHVAVAVDTPSLQLHGPTDGRSWCPDIPKHRFIQGETMEEIAVATVSGRLEELRTLVFDAAGRRSRNGLRKQWQATP